MSMAGSTPSAPERDGCAGGACASGHDGARMVDLGIPGVVDAIEIGRGGFAVVYQANREQIRNPHLIHPGQIFVLPAR